MSLKMFKYVFFMKNDQIFILVFNLLVHNKKFISVLGFHFFKNTLKSDSDSNCLKDKKKIKKNKKFINNQKV